jgi:hypothetical protein
MDIVKKVKPLKASYESLNIYYKSAAAVILVSMLSLVVPHDAYAQEVEPQPIIPLVFEVGDHTQYVSELEAAADFEYRHLTAVQKLQNQLRLTEALKDYLRANRSPLADYAHILIQQNNWKKIIALANAESTMCRFYPAQTANCWGVGGSNLWDMGNNLGEGISAMNHFLNTAPYRSSIKYSQMNFEQMNGLYKQPPGDHWVYNNLKVYNQLTALENSLK